jgi:RIP metalloprotease RseP
MLSWLAPIFVFGLVVLVHELGHFLAAKWMGVYAPRFSIGFGPALWRRRFGETEYIIAALPLGGYVRMASREDEASAFLEVPKRKKIKPKNDPTNRAISWDLLDPGDSRRLNTSAIPRPQPIAIEIRPRISPVDKK